MTTPEPNGHVGGECPDLIGLAAYADGRATADEADRVETHLFDCGTCLDLLRDLRASEVERATGDPASAPTVPTEMVPAEMVPPGVIAAAQALVPGPARLRLARGGSRRVMFRPAARWGSAAAAAASVAACIVGYHLGTSSFELSETTSTMLVGEMSFGAIDADEDTEFAVLVAALPEGDE